MKTKRDEQKQGTKKANRFCHMVDAILQAAASHKKASVCGLEQTGDLPDLTTLRKSAPGRNLWMLCALFDGADCDEATYEEIVNTVTADFHGVECAELTDVLTTARSVLAHLTCAPLGRLSVSEAVSVVRLAPLFASSAPGASNGHRPLPDQQATPQPGVGDINRKQRKLRPASRAAVNEATNATFGEDGFPR